MIHTEPTGWMVEESLGLWRQSWLETTPHPRSSPHQESHCCW